MNNKANAASTMSKAMIAAAVATMLAACGGGGDGGSAASTTPTGNTTGNSAPAAQTATSNNVATPVYAASSMESSIFTVLNQQRVSCGFAALIENTTLDQASKAHAQYLGTAGVISDTEVASGAGFTGTTYADRATHFGYPSSVDVTGVSAGYYTTATLSDDQYGQQLVYQWLSGVYHIAVGVWPETSVGVGTNKTAFNGFPEVQGSLTLANLQSSSASPKTFPCQGTTGVAYQATGETPTPPATSGAWGTPIAVAGGASDTILMQSATMTDPKGNIITLKVLDSATDPNKLLPKFEGVAYPTTPLQQNTQYSVLINGTWNGAPFSRNFTFTTGNVIA